MKISVQILAGNCAHTIERCLNSVKWAYEICLVYDTRHGDKARRVIERWAFENKLEHIVKIFDYDWKTNNFAHARNFGLSKHTGDWTVMLDADEELVNFETPDNKYDYYLGTTTKEECRFSSIRIIKNGIGIYYTGKRHNQIANPIDKSKLGYTNAVFAGFTTMTEAQILEKTKGLLECHIEQLTEEPENGLVHFNIARCHFGLKQWRDCIEMCHLAIQDPIETPHRAQVLIYLYIAYMNINRVYAANKWLDMCVQVLPEQLWGWNLMYEKFFKAGDFEQAQKIKDIILTTEISFLPIDMTAEQTENLLITLNIPEYESQI